jgi:hypothetical protein
MHLGSLIERHGIDVLDHLDREVDVPVLRGPQCQGDLLILPAPEGQAVPGEPISVPTEGVPLVRGENGGNTHSLVADGPVMWAPAPRRSGSLDVGVIIVPDGATAFLAHPEHAYAGIGGPGQYVVRRQREQADEIRAAAD